MFNVTQIGPQSKGIVVFTGGSNFSDHVLVILPQDCVVRSYSTPVTNSEVLNDFGDKACDHHNIKGNLVDVSSSLITSTPRVFTETDMYTGTSVTTTVPIARFLETDVMVVPMVADFYWYHLGCWLKNGRTAAGRGEVLYKSFPTDRCVMKRVDNQLRSPKSSSTIKHNYSYRFFFYDEETNKGKSVQFTTPVFMDDRTAIAYGKSLGTYTVVASSALLGNGRSRPLDPMDLVRWYETCRGIGEVDPNTKYMLGEAVQDAANSVSYVDINSSMYVRDMLALKSLITSIATTVLNVRDVTKMDAKAIANLYLSFRYGLNLTIKDTMQVRDAISRAASQLVWNAQNLDRAFDVSRGRRTVALSPKYAYYAKPIDIERSYNVKLYYTPYDKTKFKHARDFMQWDLFSDLENLWDLIPYSFVVDWFLPVGDQLGTFDTKLMLYVLEVLSCTWSILDVFTIPPEVVLLQLGGGHIYTGTLTYRHYRRFVSPVPPQPISQFDTKNPSNHIIDGAALLIQRTK